MKASAAAPKRLDTIRDYAAASVDRLLTSLVFALHRAARVRDAEAVHDLRVSIRRFTQGLIAFESFFPKHEVKKIRRQLKQLMHLAAEVRNRDIAMEYLDDLSEPPVAHKSLRERMMSERSFHEQEFVALLHRWSSREFSARWRGALGLHER